MEINSLQKCRALYEHVVLTNKRKELWKESANKLGSNFTIGPAEQVYFEIFVLIKRKEEADLMSKIIVKSFNSINLDNKKALLQFLKSKNIDSEMMEKLEVNSQRTAYRRLEKLAEKIMREFIKNLQECRYESLCG